MRAISCAIFVSVLASGCAGGYYEDAYYANGYRRYVVSDDYYRPRYRDRRVRDASYFHTAEYGVVDEYGNGWSRCRVQGQASWCRVD